MDDLDISAGVNVSLNYSCFNDPGILASTPRKTRSSTFKKPAAAKRGYKGPVLASCEKCGKEYRNLRSFATHYRTHAVQDANTRYPDCKRMRENCVQLSSQVMCKMACTSAIGEWGHQFKTFIEDLQELISTTEWRNFSQLVCDEFCVGLMNRKFCIPSSLLTLKDTDKFLSSHVCREKFYNSLLSIKNCDRQVAESFICEYILRFAEEILIFIYRALRDAQDVEDRQPVILGAQDRQIVHYVGGPVVKGFLRMGLRYPNNASWRSITQAIKTKVVEGEVVVAASDTDRYWTEVLNRGALTFVGKKCLEFFVALAELLTTLEGADGSLEHQKVSNAVSPQELGNTHSTSDFTAYKTHIRLMWDEMIGTVLSEGLSLRLMNGVIISFTQTYGRGVAFRRINEVTKRAHAAVSLRHSVAPR